MYPFVTRPSVAGTDLHLQSSEDTDLSHSRRRRCDNSESFRACFCNDADGHEGSNDPRDQSLHLIVPA